MTPVERRRERGEGGVGSYSPGLLLSANNCSIFHALMEQEREEERANSSSSFSC